MHRSAVISECGLYRPVLRRVWDASRYCLPVGMLNPSQADGDMDDPTMGRVISIAQRDGYGGTAVVNMYGYRATDPNELRDVLDPFGPENEKYIGQVLKAAAHYGAPFLCAWGAHPMATAAQPGMISLIERFGLETVCLGKTAAGYPRHPLYVKSDQPFVPFP